MHYYAIYKPYGMLSQFTREHTRHRVLGELHPFPPSVYPLGRLDRDSEGLLLLTDDRSANRRLLDPDFRHPREYWAQVEGTITSAALQQLASGVDIRIKGNAHRTLPAKAEQLEPPPGVPDRDPPIRYRKNVPDSWLRLVLTEGKNRQVRRMCAAVGFPVLRLIRVRIGLLEVPAWEPGAVRELSAGEWRKAFRKPGSFS